MKAGLVMNAFIARAFSELGGNANPIRVEGEFTGGSADSGLTAAVGAPTLCAVRPVGGSVHTDKEYSRLSRMLRPNTSGGM